MSPDSELTIKSFEAMFDVKLTIFFACDSNSAFVDLIITSSMSKAFAFLLRDDIKVRLPLVLRDAVFATEVIFVTVSGNSKL